MKVILFVLPLGLDTFAVAAALGAQGLSAGARLRTSLLMSSFEMAMPVAGLLLGHRIGSALGGVADGIAAATLLGLGAWMLLHEDDEAAKAARLARGHGFALVGLGLAVSLDELAMGFTMGLLELSIVLAVALIGVQAFAVAQLGLRLGSRLGEEAGEWAERVAGLALMGLGIAVAVPLATG